MRRLPTLLFLAAAVPVGAIARMAEGRSNTAIAARLVVTVSAVEKHVANIFTKLRLPTSNEDRRRVLAVLSYLQA